MSSLFQFPFTRLQYPGLNNPRWVSDIVCLSQTILDGLTGLAGLGPNDFAIFGGLELIQVISGPDYYTPGIFYLNGIWYYMPIDFDEGFYLTPNITPEQQYTFSEDATERPTYQINYAQTSGSPTGNTPLFTGSMNAYRLDSKTLSNLINQLIFQTTLENVQPGSFTGTITLNFTNDQAIFYNASSGNVIVTFNMANAVPGTVVTIKFTFIAGQTITIAVPSGAIAYLESGTLSSAASNINTMYFLYVGVDELNLQEIRYNISQV